LTSWQIIHRKERSKAGLETDLEEFGHKEELYPWQKGKGTLSYLSGIISNLQGDKKARMLKDLLSVSKAEFMEYGSEYAGFYGNKKAGDCWKEINRILKRHGFRMYIRPVTYQARP